MNPADLSASELSSVNADLSWAQRNQQWLTQRFAYWREQIERYAQGATPGATQLADETDDFQSAAHQLAATFGLSSFERELLVLTAGIEIDGALREALARAQNNVSGPALRLSYALALAVLPQPHWDALSPLRPLRRWGLVDFDASNGFCNALLRIEERVLHQLTGVAAFDDRLTGIVQFDDEVTAPASDELAANIASVVEGLASPLIVLSYLTQDAGYQRSGLALAKDVFEKMGLRTLRLAISALSSDAREMADIARRADREAALASAGIVIALDADAHHTTIALRFLAVLHGPAVLLGNPDSGQLAQLATRQVARFNLTAPETTVHEALPNDVKQAAQRALQQFRVAPDVFEQALAKVADLEDRTAIDTGLWDTLRVAARGGLDALAQRVVSRITFEEVVLPNGVVGQLREMASQLRHRSKVYDEWGFAGAHSRGLGIAALFCGESGTGKTLAAEAIAQEARLDLYRVDLASVVSKYIGETEKNLSRLFDAAETSGAVLLFDEADALFGKRSEVKDSHDRYANIEVAYLLQRIESYRGLVILTTNMKAALDKAFLRRIRFVIQFPFPDSAARMEIWRRQFPASAPVAKLDFAALAKLQLTGGNIRSIAINAAFRAADQGGVIDQILLADAVCREASKLDRNTGSFNLGA